MFGVCRDLTHTMWFEIPYLYLIMEGNAPRRILCEIWTSAAQPGMSSRFLVLDELCCIQRRRYTNDWPSRFISTVILIVSMCACMYIREQPYHCWGWYSSMYARSQAIMRKSICVCSASSIPSTTRYLNIASRLFIPSSWWYLHLYRRYYERIVHRINPVNGTRER